MPYNFELDFGGFGPRLWRFLTFILEVSGHDLGPKCFVILALYSCFFKIGYHFFLLIDNSFLYNFGGFGPRLCRFSTFILEVSGHDLAP